LAPFLKAGDIIKIHEAESMKTNIFTCLVLNVLIGPAFAQGGNNTAYLALGDSVPFGMNVTLLPPYSSQAPTPAEFVGYPETVAAFQHESEVNASCPGETSGSFLNTSVPDNGCNSPHFVPPATSGYPVVVIPPFKTTYGLHTSYTGSQMAFAESLLQASKNLKLVTLSLGANDVLLALPAVEAECGTNTTCAATALAPTLQTYGTNLAQILTTIRTSYRGKLVLMTYYSPAPTLNSVTQALNSVMTQVATQLSAIPGFPPIAIADGYTAFQVASVFSNGDACQAGLLIRLPASPYDSSPCDIHPSPLGRSLLSAVIELTVLTGH
jgi:lysophospholipase L1-like esterase